MSSTMIEDEFLPPCSKCDGAMSDQGTLCKLHYALIFLHYYANHYFYYGGTHLRRVSNPHPITLLMDADSALSRANPTGRQTLTTEKLFDEVVSSWTRVGQGTLYYEH